MEIGYQSKERGLSLVQNWRHSWALPSLQNDLIGVGRLARWPRHVNRSQFKEIAGRVFEEIGHTDIALERALISVATDPLDLHVALAA